MVHVPPSSRRWPEVDPRQTLRLTESDGQRCWMLCTSTTYSAMITGCHTWQSDVIKLIAIYEALKGPFEILGLYPNHSLNVFVCIIFGK
jgi:hypothetical protein